MIVKASLLTLCVIDVFLHAFGLSLIRECIHEGNVQLLYIFHLSVSELIISTFRVVQFSTVHVFENTSWVQDNAFTREVEHYLELLVYTVFSTVYYFCMLYITLDRLLACLLTMRYRAYWSVGKARQLLRVTWVIAIILFVVVEVIHEVKGFRMQDIIIYFYVPFDFFFLLTAMVTYVVIFHRHKKATRRRSEVKVLRRRMSTYQIFNQSRFYVAGLLVLTFLICNVIPGLAYLVLFLFYGQVSSNFLLGIRFSYSVSFLADGLIYIFGHPHIRILLIEKRKKIRQGVLGLECIIFCTKQRTKEETGEEYEGSILTVSTDV